ncbi:MAG: 30S ribosomal protein S12 methylthiotransferase RimO, partial [Dermatophilaceae bacterium]
YAEVTQLVEELTTHRAIERIGESVTVLVDEILDNGSGTEEIIGRSAQQGPDVDGSTLLRWPADGPFPEVGELVAAQVTDAYGVDLVAEPT